MSDKLSLHINKETFQTSTAVDPFYAYLQLTQRLGEGQVFLLDAAAESHALYNMSLVASTPIVEVQVKDGTVALAAAKPFFDYLAGTLRHQGYEASGSGVMDTVIVGTPQFYQPQDCMAFLETLRQALRALYGAEDLTPFSQGFLGYIGYDAVHYLESLPKNTLDDRDLPDIRLQWHGSVVHILKDRIDVFTIGDEKGDSGKPEYDDVEQTLRGTRSLVANWSVSPPRKPALLEGPDELTPEGDSHPSEPQEDVSQPTFEAAVKTAKDYILAGDIFQVVLSKRIRVAKRIHHYRVYEKLRHLNPSPYMFMAEYPNSRLIGASPEVQFRSVQGHAEMKPIAGTSKGRGKTEAEDLALRQRLLADEKERAEHLMLVDLCRNDLGRVSTIGSVRVEDFMVVEPYSHLFHLVSTVKSELQPEVSVFKALLSTFPAGTLSGAPKIRAMEIIDELERYRRGPYGGMIGMVDFDANANTAIVIRTIVEYDSEYFIQVGAGIVADSDPEQEWLECGHKSGAILTVLRELELSAR